VVLYLDTETRSPLSLKTAGLHKYSEQVEIVLVQWAIDDRPVHVEYVLHNGLSADFWVALTNADLVVAHMAEFDRTMLNSVYWGYAWTNLPWYCTVSQARRHGLPGTLDKLCAIFNVPQDEAKLKEGRAAMLLFCKPLKAPKDHDTTTGTLPGIEDASGHRWATKETHPREWATYLDYARLDIVAMRRLHRVMPKWNDDYEAPIWRLDQKINSRGFAVDVAFAQAAVSELAKVKADLAEATLAATHGAVQSATQVDALIRHILAEYDVDLPDLQAATIERRLADTNLPDEVRELLALRQQSSKTSTGKYKALLNTVSSDGRLRGTKAYCGAARTRRWAGKVFQPDNLPRRSPDIEQDEIDACIEATKLGVLDLVSTQPVTKMLSNAVRGVLVAPPGRKLLVGDFANIEGRGVAWLAGEEWKLAAFEDYDRGDGPDLYKTAYAAAFNVDPADVDKFQRQIGKVLELMMGYGGGVGAFITGSITYKIDLGQMADLAWPNIPAWARVEAQKAWAWARDEGRTYGLTQHVYQTCDALKRLWRAAHPRIAQFWTDLETATRLTVMTGRPTTAGRLGFSKAGTWLKMHLPSGGYLSYPGARYEHGKLSYLGVNPYSRQWSRIFTYGGKVAENATQAFARDLLCEAMLDADRDDFDLVGHVHDEIIAEEDAGGRELDDLLVHLTRPRVWAPGLPLAAAGFECTRYRKD
jgi:DNA polymerase